jgi:glycosyltransferase involved in cell wall biosynthesis
MRIFILGYPSEFGGADTELWHSVKLFRRFGIEVTLIPTWHADPYQRAKLDAVGAVTLEAGGIDQLPQVPGLADSVVVSFCNGEYLKAVDTLKQLRCRIVWVNCMTWVFPAEIEHYERHGPFSAYVFQSEFQKSELASVYRQHGVPENRMYSIHGAFDVAEFPFSPAIHRPGDPFVMGRIARDDLDKWSSNLWPIYSSVQYTRKRARLMAWSERLTEKCGPPPDWAEALSANQEPARQFLSTLHCLFPINGGARENWPRAGLEAMSLGVPIVAQNEWGWREMIDHGTTGFLANDDCELAHYAAMLAHDEELRLQIAVNARQRLTDVLAQPESFVASWKGLFHDIAEDQ